MDTTKKHNNPNPRDNANLLSKLFFCWLVPFLKYSYNHDLEMKDIYNTREAERSERVGDALERNWDKVCREARRKNIKPSLLTAIKRTFYLPYVIAAAINFTKLMIFTYGMPAALDAFIDYFNEVPRSIEKGFYLGGTVLLISFCYTVTGNHCQLYFKQLGMRIRIATGALIYRKILRLNRSSLGTTDVGTIVNLLSNDLNRFEVAAEAYYNIWFVPVVAVIGTYVMYSRVGVAAFIGIGAMLVQAIPIQGYLSKLLGRYRFKIAGRTDSRVKLMNELTKGIQVIKMYAWEKPFEKIVNSLRKKEIDAITSTSYIKSLTTSISVFTERVTLYLIVVAYVLMGNTLTGGTVFSISQVINTLQLVLCILGPLALTAYAELKTSVVRVESFLTKEEIEEVEAGLKQAVMERGLVKLNRVHASWTPNTIIETLIDVSFELPPGSFCCVVGNVGSGKSSLLQLLLRELPVSSGNMVVSGNISYASQEPWLFVSNVRNNILFGQPFQKDKYHNVVKACALERDFDLFPFGDRTHVGEDGVSLSGGQRARINLARTVYREADIYLLDDPLSAVDPHVAKHLVDRCIGGYLREKTRILVTHQTQFLNQANFVLVLNNGKMEKFLRPADISIEDLNLIGQNNADRKLEAPKASQEKFFSTLSLKSNATVADEELPGEGPEETDELIEHGSIGFDIYKNYYTAGTSVCFLIFELFLLIIAQVFCNSCDMWVTYWTNNVALLKTSSAETDLPNSYFFNSTEISETVTTFDYKNVSKQMENIDISTETAYSTTSSMNIIDLLSEKYIAQYLTDDIYIQVYTFFIIFAIFLTILRSVCFYQICMRASMNLHNFMFTNILQAKMRFYDTNPSGRILNRFSNDMGAIDEVLPSMTLFTLQVFFVGTGILIMVFIKSYFMILPTVILLIVVLWFKRVFFKAAQEVKRLERTAKAPVFSYVAATMKGISTIRSSHAEDMLSREFDTIQDEHTSTNYLFAVVFQAFGFCLDMTSLIFLTVIVVQYILNPNALSGDVGLVLSQSLIVMAMIQIGTRNSSEVANYMTSVERILQYTKLDKEGPFESLPGYKPPKNWPESGRITFKNVYLSYVIEEGPVLKNLTLEIEPGEKIGIVGRTGAGKSTLISAIFRLAPTEGTIQIDGLDISRIGLTDLRSKISIIPQEPTLFSESVRYNLDPFGKCHDDVLWNALEAVELKKSIDSLDMIVSEGGSNFSAGQRQLICLARAIVRNNKVLVMDEATANVDPHTDSMIQESIRKNFKHCTVLTVAHRLNTIMDSDRVIVMDAGEMKEFAPPHVLLQNNKSEFSLMVKETGADMEKELRKIAEDHFYETRNKDV